MEKGLSTGHIIIHYKETSQRLWKFTFYALFYGIIGGSLCKFSINDGLIPLNKNLWYDKFKKEYSGFDKNEDFLKYFKF